MDAENIQSPMSVHDLPDEILVLVFAFLSPRELLGTVTKVCKRWQGLTREPLAWRHANFCMWHDWRIWQRAPMLGHVHVLAANNAEEERLRRLVQLEGPRIVRSLRLVLRHPQHAVAVMQRFKPSVRAVDLQVGGPSTPDEEWVDMFNAIGKIAELRSLSIRPCPTGRDIPYDGQIGRGCPHLRHLRVRGHEGLAVALLRDLRGRLTSLSISPQFGGESGELFEALSACKLVRDLVIPTNLLGAVGDLKELRKLKMIAEPDIACVTGAVSAASPALAVLEELSIVPSPRRGPFHREGEPDAEINRIIEGLAQHLRSVKILDIRDVEIYDEYLSELLNNVREIQKIDLRCKIYHLQQLSCLHHVREVTARLDSRFEFVPYVRNAINALGNHSQISFDIQFCER